jgi:sterol desaturase/sphingolipid hydroxylase (fatty acid hydroxylase superfamily)
MEETMSILGLVINLVLVVIGLVYLHKQGHDSSTIDLLFAGTFFFEGIRGVTQIIMSVIAFSYVGVLTGLLMALINLLFFGYFFKRAGC